MAKRRWSDLSEAQRRGLLVLTAAQLTLCLAAILSIRRTPAGRVRGSKRRWYALAFVNWVGPVAWFAAGRRPAQSPS